MLFQCSPVELEEPLVKMKQRGRKVKSATECSWLRKKLLVLWL
jgi:Zn-finger protein